LASPPPAAAMADSGDQFEAAMLKVKAHFDREEYDRALPLCAKALQSKPDSAMVRRCRVFALLSLSKWAEALQACEGYATREEAFGFERAYCLYRLNRFQDALAAIDKGKSTGEDESTLKRLEAQVRYRMGEYENCARMYEGLYEEDPDEPGLLVNAVASRVSGDQPQQALRMMAQMEDHLETSYELCFNLACALIDDGRPEEAEQRLEQAKGICVRELAEAEETPDEDIHLLDNHEELAAINVQRACVLQRSGLSDKANELYSSVLKHSGSGKDVDVTVLAVACNNVVALRSQGKSLFDSLKRINVASKEVLEHKLTRKQQIEIGTNKLLLLLQARKIGEARKELARLDESFPGHPRVVVLQAAIAYTEKKGKDCEEVLTAYLKEHPGTEEVLVALSQLHSQHNRVDLAVAALTQLPVERRANPRMVEMIVAVHQKQKTPEKAVTCLREAIDYWKGKADGEDEQTFAAVLRIAARLAMELKDKVFAAEVFKLYLEKIDGSDSEALCGLVAALAGTSPDEAEQYAQRLQLPDYGHLDPEELELSAIPKVGGLFKKREAKDAEGEGAEKAKSAKTKKKKKIRYPKSYDPENPGPPPDPERWLPKRERTEFKKKMKKRDRVMLRGPQGAMPADDNAFRKQGPSTAQVEVSKDKSTGRNQGRRKQGKK